MLEKKMNTITEYDVEALVDSQLTWEDEKQVRRELESNLVLRQYYEQLLAQKKLVIAWWTDQESRKSDYDFYEPAVPHFSS